MKRFFYLCADRIRVDNEDKKKPLETETKVLYCTYFAMLGENIY